MDLMVDKPFNLLRVLLVMCELSQPKRIDRKTDLLDWIIASLTRKFGGNVYYTRVVIVSVSNWHK